MAYRGAVNEAAYSPRGSQKTGVTAAAGLNSQPVAAAVPPPSAMTSQALANWLRVGGPEYNAQFGEPGTSYTGNVDADGNPLMNTSPMGGGYGSIPDSVLNLMMQGGWQPGGGGSGQVDQDGNPIYYSQDQRPEEQNAARLKELGISMAVSPDGKHRAYIDASGKPIAGTVDSNGINDSQFWTGALAAGALVGGAVAAWPGAAGAGGSTFDTAAGEALAGGSPTYGGAGAFGDAAALTGTDPFIGAGLEGMGLEAGGGAALAAGGAPVYGGGYGGGAVGTGAIGDLSAGLGEVPQVPPRTGVGNPEGITDWSTKLTDYLKNNWQDIAKSGVDAYKSFGGGAPPPPVAGGLGGGGGNSAAMAAALRRREDPLPQMFNPNYQPPKGGM